MKNIKIEFTNERIIPASGLAVVGAILGKSDFVKRCNRMDVTPNRSQHQIKNGDILLTYISMLCMGKPEFQAVHEMDDDRDFPQNIQIRYLHLLLHGYSWRSEVHCRFVQ